MKKSKFTDSQVMEALKRVEAGLSAPPVLPTSSIDMRCITDARGEHETELRRFLRHRTRNDAEADDLLQEVFLQALPPDLAMEPDDPAPL